MNMNKPKKGTGSTLDAGNVAALATAWRHMRPMQHPIFDQVYGQLVKDNKGVAVQTLKKHDPLILTMLRNWLQASMLIEDAIVERIREIEELAAAAEAAKKLQEERNETH